MSVSSLSDAVSLAGHRGPLRSALVGTMAALGHISCRNAGLPEGPAEESYGLDARGEACFVTMFYF